MTIFLNGLETRRDLYRKFFDIICYFNYDLALPSISEKAYRTPSFYKKFYYDFLEMYERKSFFLMDEHNEIYKPKYDKPKYDDIVSCFKKFTGVTAYYKVVNSLLIFSLLPIVDQLTSMPYTIFY
jgi:hypothetical protein